MKQTVNKFISPLVKKGVFLQKINNDISFQEA